MPNNNEPSQYFDARGRPLTAAGFIRLGFEPDPVELRLGRDEIHFLLAATAVAADRAVAPKKNATVPAGSRS
jgi:hypothetical protein